MFELNAVSSTLFPPNSRGQPWNGGGASFTRDVYSQSNGQRWRERPADLRPVSDQLPTGRHLGFYRAQTEAVPWGRSLLRETRRRWHHVIAACSASRTHQETPPRGDRHSGHTGRGRGGRKASNARQRNLPQARECTDRYEGEREGEGEGEGFEESDWYVWWTILKKKIMFARTSTCRCVEAELSREQQPLRKYTRVGVCVTCLQCICASHLKRPILITQVHIHTNTNMQTLLTCS